MNQDAARSEMERVRIARKVALYTIEALEGLKVRPMPQLPEGVPGYQMGERGNPSVLVKTPTEDTMSA